MSRLGQLIITGIKGLSLSEDEANFLSDENIGGVILFSNNYESPAQLAELVNSIQSHRSKYPLYICVDHEGGRVQRFKKGFTHFPPMMELAKLKSPKIIFDVANVMAKELSACGVNLNFSPVCDVLNNSKNKVIGDRAFGTNHDEVSKYISSVIRGLQVNNVMACAKHFPGHGCTTKDSHFDLPIINKSISELREIELVPFVKAAKSRVEFIMMSHIVFKGLDEELPCSLSSIAHKFLREELKYNKIIISDDMQMKAIADNYSYMDAAVKAVNAGSDIIEYRDMDAAKEALEGLKKSYSEKVLSVNTVNEHFDRIISNKKSFLKSYSPIYIPDLNNSLVNDEHLALLDDIHDKLAQV